jgi:phosphate transport system permease protein
MDVFWIAALLLAVLALTYQIGLSRSRQIAQGAGTTAGTRLHSRPQYHGAAVALWSVVPLLLVILLWLLVANPVTRWFVMPMLPAEIVDQGGAALATALQRVRSIASGFGVAGEPAPYEIAAAERLSQIEFFLRAGALTLGALLAAAGFYRARSRIAPRFRARNEVERVIQVLLIFCSVVAIMTTLGIVLSLAFETLRFFSFVHPLDFFFGLTWNPRYAVTGDQVTGSYGMLPLLWGTLMVAGIAMFVAIPVGLMTAIYLSQYAPARVRSIVKPIVEILAGIPTIVYGFFALVTVGPFLSNMADALGFSINTTSALTAGLVMGIMIIPFISSLSDDIIRQVPRAMRDGSLGLGATKSETIRKVVLPAALPGIVGAILLAVSRAIGETMIVLLAAGNSPVLRFDPTEPTSTITVTIVAQMFGDSDFSAPQSLVAFALGLTLFVITLLLNVVALQIVRRYREQYE